MAIQRDFHQFQAQGYKASVRVATSGALPAYTKDGPGQILTANANGVIPDQDGVTLAPGDSILYWTGAGLLAPDNGIYVVTSVGSGGTPWVLTRRADFSQSSQLPAALQVSIAEGGNAGSIFNLRTPAPIVLNTTDLAFDLASGAGGAGVIEQVATGETATIPANQKMLHTSDLTIGEVATLNVWDGTGTDDTGTPDWAVTGAGIESAGAARTGTNGWDTQSQSGGATTKFNYGSLLDVAAQTGLSFWVQPKEYPANATLQVYWEDAGNVLNGNILDVDNYSGMTIDIWNGVGIPIEDFGLTADVQYLVFRYNDVGIQSHWLDDLLLTQSVGGADLDMEGTLEQFYTDRNYSENVIPIRTRRTVAEGEQMLFSGPMRVDGILRIDGVVTDITPSDANQLLATLGEVVALDQFLVGGGSPMKAVSAAEVRVILDTPTTAETQAIADAAAAAAADHPPNPKLVVAATVESAAFNAVENTFHRWDTGGFQATLPATPPHNTMVGFVHAGGTDSVLTVFGNGAPIQSNGASGSTATIAGPYTTAVFRYDGTALAWYQEAGNRPANQPNLVGSALIQSSAFNAFSGTLHRWQTGGFTATLPASPTHNTLIGFTEVAGTSGTLTIGGNGNQIQYDGAIGANATIDGPYSTVTFRFDNNSSRWIAESDQKVAITVPVLTWDGGGIRNSAFTAASNLAYRIDSAATFTITLPASPADSDEILFADAGSSNTFPNGVITLSGNGNTIHGPNAYVSATLVLGFYRQGLRIKYFSGQWTVISDGTMGFLTGGPDNSILTKDHFSRPSRVVMPDHSVLTRASGNSMVGTAMDPQSVLARVAAGPVTLPSTTTSLLGRESGDLAFLGPANLKSIVAPTLGTDAILDAQATTNDGNALTIASYITQTDDTTQRLKFTVTALEITTDDAAYFDVSALFHRSNTGSTVTEKDVVFVNGPFRDAGAAAWTVTMSITAQTINIQVTGEVGKTIKWKITGTVVED